MSHICKSKAGLMLWLINSIYPSKEMFLSAEISASDLSWLIKFSSLSLELSELLKNDFCPQFQYKQVLCHIRYSFVPVLFRSHNG